MRRRPSYRFTRLHGLVAGGLAVVLALSLRMAFGDGAEAGRPRPLPPRPTLADAQAAEALGALERFELASLSSAERERQELIALEDWQQVYDVLGVLDYSPEQVEAVLIAKLAAELGWTGQQRTRLSRLLAEERAAFTREAVSRHGGEALYAVLDRPRDARRDFMRRLGDEREVLRRRYDGRYAQHFDERHRAAIDRHLRSGSIHLVRNTGDRSVSITGVGHLPPADVGEDE